ncbi:MAG: fructose-6-phosphate aldolase [candidate division Zixibacteria bacterium 4484_93]|nr:MAG: fructose-6-phosphate aldolase [candidate division Zixibacteria bacterium 4484_93]
MKFFIDTANIEQIREANSWGVLDGVTTNPSLAAREEGSYKKILEEIADIVDGSISAEVIAQDYDGMMKEAHELIEISDRIAVKIPLTKVGLKAIKSLSDEGVDVNTTLIFSPMQALLAAKAGASFVSPFVGRLDDISSMGMKVVQDIRTIFDNYGFDTEIIVASIRHPMHVYEAAMIGADIATIPFNVLEKLFNHPLTDIGIERFLSDWRRANKQF